MSLIDDQRQANQGVVAQLTKFGWMVLGSYRCNTKKKGNIASLLCCIKEPTEASVRGFWELDSFGIHGESLSRSDEKNKTLTEFY